MEQAVSGLVAEAVRRHGKAANLGRQLKQLVGRDYDESSISKWARGEVQPPANIFLAVAKVSDLSVDEFMQRPALGDVGRRLDALERAMGAIAEQSSSELLQEIHRLRETMDDRDRLLAEALEAVARGVDSQVAMRQVRDNLTNGE